MPRKRICNEERTSRPEDDCPWWFQQGGVWRQQRCRLGGPASSASFSKSAPRSREAAGSRDESPACVAPLAPCDCARCLVSERAGWCPESGTAKNASSPGAASTDMSYRARKLRSPLGQWTGSRHELWSQSARSPSRMHPKAAARVNLVGTHRRRFLASSLRWSLPLHRSSLRYAPSHIGGWRR